MTLLRHLLSILLLPVMVVGVAPAWIRHGTRDTDMRLHGAIAVTTGRVLGAVLFVAGLSLFAWCVALFARVGRGTLAPWDPTQRLVWVGPYRHSRNPMITAVAVMLAGQALWFGSLALAAWMLLVILVNHVYFVRVEEPGLVRRFGADYEEYRHRVPRWLPRP